MKPLIKYGQKLTRREKQVLAFTCKGLSARQIGYKLGISHRTVEEYKRRIRIKKNIIGYNWKYDSTDIDCLKCPKPYKTKSDWLSDDEISILKMMINKTLLSQPCYDLVSRYGYKTLANKIITEFDRRKKKKTNTADQHGTCV